MPLHAEKEAFRRGQRNRLDLAVRRYGLGEESRRQAIDPLAVQRVHSEAPFTEHLGETPAGCDLHRMGGTVLRLQRRVLVLAVIGAAGNFLDMLVQRAAERDVQLLEAAADREHRLARGDGGLEQRQRGGIAMLVLHHPGPGRRPAIVPGRDIGGRAGEQKPVNLRQDFLRRDRRIEHGQQQRQRVGAPAHRLDIFLAHEMKWMRPQHPPVAGKSNNRTARGHGNDLMMGRRSMRECNATRMTGLTLAP